MASSSAPSAQPAGVVHQVGGVATAQVAGMSAVQAAGATS